ncbi:hypothetical protein Cni_G09738 [Canna indica]|uniref:Uncharacterized protein n=1 Tax=Canna indica TaxID=4628 RepID=A0AAQ3K4W0_9LILI|nr:hypothetical protein Cni_G09738 [Canna indica]
MGKGRVYRLRPGGDGSEAVTADRRGKGRRDRHREGKKNGTSSGLNIVIANRVVHDRIGSVRVYYFISRHFSSSRLFSLGDSRLHARDISPSATPDSGAFLHSGAWRLAFLRRTAPYLSTITPASLPCSLPPLRRLDKRRRTADRLPFSLSLIHSQQWPDRPEATSKKSEPDSIRSVKYL